MKSPSAADLPLPTFADLGLPDGLLRAVTELGFTAPTPIQARAIPALLEGRDIVGVAQTGTGKTAAFGLAFLARIDVSVRQPQALVLTPTRELAIQVSRAIESFAADTPGLRVLTVYGGAPWLAQKRELERGVHIVIGTPGRVLDHLDRGTLNVSQVNFLVLDEGDEMLSMGFSEDIDKILSHTPTERQTALFSATMPKAIRATVRRHLRDPLEIAVTRQASTVENVEQRFAVVPTRLKIEALTRILSLTDAAAAIIFVRTRSAAEEVGRDLAARGINAATISGDIAQAERERIMDRLRGGQTDVLVATDVAARGLDVDRVGLVVNYDLPHDSEGYVHRVGRTGRAGRSGVAMSFVGPKDLKKLRAIERTIQLDLIETRIPTLAEVSRHRAATAVTKAVTRLAVGNLAVARSAVLAAVESGLDPIDLATALAALAAGDVGTGAGSDGSEADEVFGARRFGRDREEAEVPRAKQKARKHDRDEWGQRDSHKRGAYAPPSVTKSRPVRDHSAAHHGPARPETYWISVGHRHGAAPRSLVNAMTDEGGVRAQDIGRIDIFDKFSLVDVRRGLSREALRRIGQTRISGQAVSIRPDARSAR
jgi:ATP-dependent RNA helicase DeaD